jgi:hypothetical protein
LAREAGTTVQSTRTVVNHLAAYSIIACHPTRRGTIVTFCDFDRYVVDSTAPNKQSNTKPTNGQHQTNNQQKEKNKKREKLLVDVEKEGQLSQEEPRVLHTPEDLQPVMDNLRRTLGEKKYNGFVEGCVLIHGDGECIYELVTPNPYTGDFLKDELSDQITRELILHDEHATRSIRVAPELSEA